MYQCKLPMTKWSLNESLKNLAKREGSVEIEDTTATDGMIIFSWKHASDTVISITTKASIDLIVNDGQEDDVKMVTLNKLVTCMVEDKYEFNPVGIGDLTAADIRASLAQALHRSNMADLQNPELYQGKCAVYQIKLTK